MIRIISNKSMGRSDRGWLHSLFHFSFAEYYNPQNIHFGPLRVVNDDQIEPGTGFDTHPHEDMEIISYVVDGTLSHKDNMGNERTVTRGQVQYMSAGTGVLHSEHNRSYEPLRFLQIWIIPDRQGYQPNYGDYAFDWKDRVNTWLKIASGNQGDAPVTIHQDVTISVLSLDQGKSIRYEIAKDRQVYLIQIEGSSILNGERLNMRDAAEITKESTLHVEASENAHFILFDMVAE